MPIRKKRTVFKTPQEIVKHVFDNKAIRIRHEGVCHCSRQWKYIYSFVHSDYQERIFRSEAHGELMEECGFYCVACRWSNPGSRPVRDDNGT